MSVALELEIADLSLQLADLSLQLMRRRRHSEKQTNFMLQNVLVLETAMFGNLHIEIAMFASRHLEKTYACTHVPGFAV